MRKTCNGASASLRPPAVPNTPLSQFDLRPSKRSTIGEYCSDMLTRMEYYGTIFPRLPVKTARGIKVRLLRAAEEEARAQRHLSNRDSDAFKSGSKAHALYEDEENPLQWYECVVDEVVPPKEEVRMCANANARSEATLRCKDYGRLLVTSLTNTVLTPARRLYRSAQWDRPSYVVTFLEYGNTETVTLGMIDSKPAPLETDEELTKKVVAIDRKGVEATGRDYARIPLGLKGSLAMKVEGSGGGKGREEYRPPAATKTAPPPKMDKAGDEGREEGGGKKRARTHEEEARAEEKRRKLREMYG